MKRYFIDCEFDGHNGSIISMAIVPEAGNGLYLISDSEIVQPQDAWVIENVVPHLHKQPSNAMTYNCVDPNSYGMLIRKFIGNPYEVEFIADSPVDIARLCLALSTAPDGGYAPNATPLTHFRVYDVDCYPTGLYSAVQHNAYWDALALRARFL